MDHRDSIESPSGSRNKIIEKRMEMVALLLNSRIEEEDKGRKEKVRRQEMKRRNRSYSPFYGQKPGKLARLASKLHRMFL